MNLIRGLVFNLFYTASIAFFGLYLSVVAPLVPKSKRHILFNGWPATVSYLLRIICGIRYEVEGLENRPNTPVVIVANHQSSWETLILYSILAPLCTVLKKELTYIPVFGWALYWAQPIAIDRSKKATALKEILRQGQERLKSGLSVMIFPEGTRVPANETKPHMPGGAMLAVKAGAPILPVVHNAGAHWPAHKISKKPGVIKVKIGKPIDASGMSPKQLNKQLEEWINREKNLLPK